MSDASFEPPVHPSETPDAAPEPLSVTDKFIGILTEPVPTYENVRATGFRKSDWLLPLMLVAIIAAVTTLLRFTNPEFAAQIKDQQIAQMQKMVEEGKMTQEQADQAVEQLESFAGIQKVIVPVGALISIGIIFFLACLIYWLAARFGVKAAITFAGMLSVLGLAMYIDIIDSIAGILVGFLTKNYMATFSPAMFMQPDLGSTPYKLASALNPIVIWKYVVFSLGLAIVGSISRAKAFAVVFGIWIFWTLLFALVKIPGVG